MRTAAGARADAKRADAKRADAAGVAPRRSRTAARRPDSRRRPPKDDAKDREGAAVIRRLVPDAASAAMRGRDERDEDRHGLPSLGWKNDAVRAGRTAVPLGVVRIAAAIGAPTLGGTNDPKRFAVLSIAASALVNTSTAASRGADTSGSVIHITIGIMAVEATDIISPRTVMAIEPTVFDMVADLLAEDVDTVITTMPSATGTAADSVVPVTIIIDTGRAVITITPSAVTAVDSVTLAAIITDTGRTGMAPGPSAITADVNTTATFITIARLADGDTTSIAIVANVSRPGRMLSVPRP